MRVSEEHGLNPTCGICFWCGEPDGTVVLLGAAYKGEAPMHMVVGYEPCDTCRAQFDQGVLLIQTVETPIGDRPPIMGPHYPTGRIAVVREEAIPRMFDEKFAANILKSRKALVDEAAWLNLGLPNGS